MDMATEVFKLQEGADSSFEFGNLKVELVVQVPEM